MYVKVTVTAEDGETASDVTLSKVAENEDYGKIEILSAEAVATNKVEVLLANPVITTDTTIEITKGTTTITVSKTSWESTFDKVTLTTDANMIPGEYTVTLTSETDETNTDSDTFEVAAQEINIVILNETALTNKEAVGVFGAHEIAYAYYDVLDQYGESIRTSTSITWAGSATPNANKATGLIQLTKSDGNAWVYGDKIYLTGVHTKTGASVTQELTVGQEQSLDSIEVAGFVKKNTTKLEKTLPKDFKYGEWYLLFNAFDQNSNPIPAGGITDEDISIISDNVLVVSAVKGVQDAPITIEDVDYNAVLVEPGIKVSDGGAVTLTAIALRTGTKTTYDCIVGVDQVVTSFTMSAPAGIVADGDSVEIPFVALDENGDKVTDFVTLAKHQTFNALSFSVGGEGKLVLAEQNDGSAKLTYVDEQFGWADSRATDGIDRPVSLTAIVVGGETDNQMLSVSDKRRPDAIKSVDLDDVYVEGATIALSIGDLTFYDQYNETMKDAAALAFFGATKYTGGNDFAGYNFSVKATYSGNGGLYVPGASGQPYEEESDDYLLSTGSQDCWVLSNNNTIATKGFGGLTGDDVATVTTTENVTASISNEGFKYEIVKIKSNKIADSGVDDFETVSRTKSKLFTVVDIKKVKGFQIAELGTLYVGEGTHTGDGKITTEDGGLEALTGDELVPFANKDGITKGVGAPTSTLNNPYERKIEVTGTYNGKEVTIPNNYFTVAGAKVTVSSGWDEGVLDTADDDDRLVDTVVSYEEDGEGNGNGGLTLQDLYDKTSSRGVSKLATDTLKATVRDIWTPKSGEEVLDKNHIINKVATVEQTGITATDTTPKAATAFVGTAVNYSLSDPEDSDSWRTVDEAIAAVEARLTELEEFNAATYQIVTEGVEGYAETNATNGDRATAAKNTEVASLTALLVELENELAPETVDTASLTVTLSDQAPKATSFDGFGDAYTAKPVLTAYGIEKGTDGTELGTYFNLALADDGLAVLDQYGIDMEVGVDEINKKASNIDENEAGYVENNFTPSGNNTPDLTIVGAERGDKWTLTLSYQGLEQSAEMTVGADNYAQIVNATNWYLTDEKDADGNPLGLKATLEEQRRAILDIA